MRLQLPGRGSALLWPLRMRRGRHQKLRASEIARYPDGQAAVLRRAANRPIFDRAADSIR
jgi:hypothetical protein